MKNKLKIKIFAGIGFVCLLALLMVFLFYGKNFAVLKSLFSEKLTQEEIRVKLASFGWRGYVTFSILAMLQVVLTFLPAEPVQVLSGMSFGFPIGLLCCIVGVFAGNTIIYLLYRAYGDRLSAFFDKNLNLDWDKASSSGKVTLLVFILYFLPAIPYGMICFFAATMRMKYPRYIVVTLLGSIPSVCIGVGLGHLAMNTSLIISLAVFAVLVVLLVIVLVKKDKLMGWANKLIEKKKLNKAQVRKYSPIKLHIAYIISRIVFFLKGVKVRYNKINAPKKGESAIVLCNHGSFVDFAYAGTLIRERAPNFIVARMYFYKNIFGSVLRRFGCFPKSMFTMDLDSAKNCLRVLKSKGVLAMMPEARLSTVGRFEDIQPSTFEFLKAAGVNVYCVKINGSYLANPKWGDKMRRGSLVEASIDLLLPADSLKEMSAEQVKERVEGALYFDDFEWLKTQPEIRYKSKNLAKGLENILSTCPICHQKYTIEAKGHTVKCSHCGLTAVLDERYGFKDGMVFDNFVKWYDWQESEMKKEIEENESYEMRSRVTLKHSSRDGKTILRYAGEGECVLNRQGLTYRGTEDKETVEKHFPMDEIYRLLFGAGENFEIYSGKEIYYFVPEEKRSAVDWYIASKLLKQQ
ncbi:MAG: VTT domain-containing protein [Clostridia bacterium]|nr:VTT domain-containing protein [Clostridia bacterium]